MDDTVRQKIVKTARFCTVEMGYPGVLGTSATRHVEGVIGRALDEEEFALLRAEWEKNLLEMGVKPRPPEV